MASAGQQVASIESVVKVGDGRGFIVEHSNGRFIITAAHCLPRLPPAGPAINRTYRNLLGALKGGEEGNNVWADCFFADPVADIAILGQPDNQGLPDQADAYDALIDEAPVLAIGSEFPGEMPADEHGMQYKASGYVLTLDGQWIESPLYIFRTPFGFSLSIGFTKRGMSGSPILNSVGEAVGVIAVGTEVNGEPSFKQGPQPILCRNLPGWFLRDK